VFIGAELNEVMVPKDPDYLKSILPALEELKAKHDRVIEKWVRGIFSPKLKNEILGRIWHRVMTESSAKDTKGNSKNEKTVRN